MEPGRCPEPLRMGASPEPNSYPPCCTPGAGEGAAEAMQAVDRGGSRTWSRGPRSVISAGLFSSGLGLSLHRQRPHSSRS